jgi:outer membrane protein OmpA-like peptidoglycan-associated protein
MHMANPASIQERFSTGSPSAALRAAVLNLTPIVFAAILVGCSTKAQTRGAAQTTTQAQAVQQPSPAPAAPAGYQPAPYEEPATPSPQAEEETTVAPLAFKDEGGGGAQEEDAARPEVYAEEAAEATPEEQAPPQQFTDATGPVAEEEPLAQRPFVDEEVGAAKDEGVVAPQQFSDDAAPAKDEPIPQQQFSDDAAPARDEDILAQEQFTDEAPATDEDVVAQQQFTDEAPAKDEDILAQQQFTDETTPAQEEVTAPEVYKDEVAEAAPEEAAPTPETFTDDKVAQAEPAKPPPVTMLPITITVEAEPLFDFDKYSIRADSRKKLDDLVKQLKGVTYGEVITVGFADPIGTAKYNQRLSEQRAASVKRYLVSKGIPANKIKTEGRGKTEQYASYKSCKGQGKKKVIACLQPDRRVEVTVTAEKQQ